ncbi:hypothetical protein IJI55_02870, partial [Candidatus Saccharibacteria bacterium]|nr:hypothetical protein [Candidatus Saccharibacteria bacterium]
SITQTSQWSGNIYDRPMVEVAHGLGDQADKTNQYGTWGNVYYNWCAATATSNSTTPNCSTASQVDQSICPKGWTLPNGGNQSANKSWARLFGNDVGYNYTAGSQFVNNTNVLGFALYYGRWHLGLASEYGQGAYGYFWSSTPISEREKIVPTLCFMNLLIFIPKLPTTVKVTASVLDALQDERFFSYFPNPQAHQLCKKLKIIFIFLNPSHTF